MNRVILMGRLTRDPYMGGTEGTEGTVARYTLAVDRRSNRERPSDPTADFIRCVAFGKQAEFAEKYLHKGSKITVAGRIRTGSYINQHCQKIYTTDVVIEEQEFAESKAASEYRKSAGTLADETEKLSIPDDGFFDIPGEIIEEIPFQ